MSISLEDFLKLEIRIGTITGAERVENEDKLFKLQVDLGAEKRQIVAGIAQFYPPEELVGKQILILVNLQPRTFRGIESQGMMLAADHNGKPVLLHPDKQVENGTVIK